MWLSTSVGSESGSAHCDRAVAAGQLGQRLPTALWRQPSVRYFETERRRHRPRRGRPGCLARGESQEIGSCPFQSSQNRRPGTAVVAASCALAVWVWILGFCLAALVATYMLFVEPPPPRKIVIASGGRNGAYLPFRPAIRRGIARRTGLTVEVRETAGSVENLRLLGQKGSGVAVAIVQSGVAEPRRARALSCAGQPVPRAVVGFLPGRKAARATQPARGQTDRRRSAGQRHPCHRPPVARRQRPDRIHNPRTENPRAVLVEDSVAAAAIGVAKRRARCRVLRRRVRGRLHSGPAERSQREIC